VLRDVDVLQRIPRAEVGLTLTTTSDRLSRFLEVRAPLASRRLRALTELHAAGVRTYAFVGPLLLHFRYDREALDALFAKIARAGVTSVFVEHINLRPYIKQRLWQILKAEPATIQKVYHDASTVEHRQALDAMISGLLEKHGLKLRLNQVLYHNENASTPSGPGTHEP
jgi:DNA repair photolyase